MIRWKKPRPSLQREFTKTKIRRVDEIRANRKVDDDASPPVDVSLPRCPWTRAFVGKGFIGKNGREHDIPYMAFHDQEWGPRTIRDDNQYLLECLAICMMSSPAKVRDHFLNRRDLYRHAFKNWDPEKVSKLSEDEIAAMSDLGMRNLKRINALINNTAKFDAICKQQADGRFITYLEQFAGQRGPRDQSNLPIPMTVAEIVAKDLIKNGFRGVQARVTHRFLCMIGFLDDHDWVCWKHRHHSPPNS